MSKRFKRIAKPFKDRIPVKLYNLTRVVEVLGGAMAWSCEKYMVVAPTDLPNGQYNPYTMKLNEVQGYSFPNFLNIYESFRPMWTMEFKELRRLMRQALAVAAENNYTARFEFNNAMNLLTVSNSTPLGEYRGDATINPDLGASDFNQTFNIKVIAEWIGQVVKDEYPYIYIQNLGTAAIGFKTADGECLFMSREV
jgi:hypothetical protein